MESINAKKAILTSIIATILFVYLLDPILKFIGTLLFEFGSSIFRSYIDNLFQKAALLVIPDPSTSLVNFMEGAISGTLISLTALLFFRKQLSEIKKVSNAISFVDKYLRWTLLLVSLVYIPMTLLTIYSNEFQSKIVSSFNQHLVAIAPYISDNEIKLLKSEWTQMKSQKDYDAIYIKLNQIAQKNKIILPKNNLY